jgi:hypothetical protein
MPKGIYKRKNSGNKMCIDDGMVYILSNKKEKIILDEEDIIRTQSYTWWIDAKGYAVTHVRSDDGSRYPLFMHRLIMDAPTGFDVDHINHCTTDNRKQNLRICTHLQNCSNRKMSINNSSGIKGVGWHKRKGQWQARVMFNGRSVSVGYFNELIDAKRATESKRQEIFGEFSCNI